MWVCHIKLHDISTCSSVWSHTNRCLYAVGSSHWSNGKWKLNLDRRLVNLTVTIVGLATKGLLRSLSIVFSPLSSPNFAQNHIRRLGSNAAALLVNFDAIMVRVTSESNCYLFLFNYFGMIVWFYVKIGSPSWLKMQNQNYQFVPLRSWRCESLALFNWK